MAKKKSKKKKDKDLGFRAEYHNLVTIFVGIFLLYSLNSGSMGLVGNFMQNIFKGLFGGLSFVIPFIVIIAGILGFFEGNEYVYRLKNSKVYYVVVTFVLFVFYGLINARSIPVDVPFKSNMINDVMQMGVEGTGTGLITSTIAYYIKAIFGITGGWLISIFALVLCVLFTFNISIQDLLANVNFGKGKSKNKGTNLKEKVSNLKKSALDMISDEVDENTMEQTMIEEKKPGFLKGMMEKAKHSKDNIAEKEPAVSLEDGVDDKTIKIVGFNKAEDDYLEILEGTQSGSDLDILKNLQSSPLDKATKENKDFDKTQHIENTQPIDFNEVSKYENYKKPGLEILNKFDKKTDENGKKKVLKNASLLEKTLSDFGVEAKVNQVTVGPTITRYEIQPSPGVKVSKIVNLTDDLALSLAAKSIRMEAPIPGKSAIGIEVPNEEGQMVGLREVLESDEFKNFESPLAMALGKDIGGKPVIADIAKMPHLLIAGSTGSGKSVCVNTLINSILYKANPDEVKFLLIDPKVVELASYNGIPHLLIPVVTDPKKAANALNWAVVEMNRRYKLFAENQVKDITSYNEKAEEKIT